MDSDVSHGIAPPTTRRLTRSSSKAVNVGPTPRGPLKRTRRRAENKTPPTAVNGAKDEENDSQDDDESPSKKSKPEVGGVEDGSGDEMDVQDTDEDHCLEQDAEMSTEEDSHPFASQEKRSFGKPLTRDMNVPMTAAVSSLELADTGPNLSRRRTGPAAHQDPEPLETKRVEPSRRSVVGSNKAAPQHGLQENRREALSSKSCSMSDYRKKMEGGVYRTVVLPRPDQRYASSKVSSAAHLVNSVLPPKPAPLLRKQGIAKECNSESKVLC